jgi:ATP:ADP antiporter, AAA family
VLFRSIAQNTEEAKVSSLGNLFSSEGSSFSTESSLDDAELTTDVGEIMSLENYQKVIDLHANQVMQKSREANLEKMELAKMIGLMPPESSLSGKLPALIQDESPEVARFAMESASRLKKEAALPGILEALENPLKREDAVSALIKFEDKSIDRLQPLLTGRKPDLGVKKAALSVLAQIGSHRSIKIMLDLLPKAEPGLTSSLIDALDKIRSEQPDIYISPLSIQPQLLNLIKQQYKLMLKKEGAAEKENQAVMEWKKKSSDKLSNIFKLMGLLYSHNEIMKAYQNIQTGTRKSVAYALELLDNTLQKELRDLIIPLVEEYPPDQRRKKYRQIIDALE